VTGWLTTAGNPNFWISKLHFYMSSLAFYNFPYAFGYLLSLGVYALPTSGATSSPVAIGNCFGHRLLRDRRGRSRARLATT